MLGRLAACGAGRAFAFGWWWSAVVRGAAGAGSGFLVGWDPVGGFPNCCEGVILAGGLGTGL